MHGAVPLLQDYLTHSARHHGEKVALVCGPRRVTYNELEISSNALAHDLVDNGVVRGDRVIIFAENTVETVISFWAALKANAVACVINPLTKPDKLAYLLNDCQPSALITDKPLYSIICQSLCRVISFGSSDNDVAVRWDVAVGAGCNTPPARSCIDIDLAAIIYTSGTTGNPKGVMLTHRNMLTACVSVASYLKLREDEVILNVLPLAFSYGLYQMITAASVSARLVLERSFAFPAQALKLIEDERVTGLPGVPTIFATMAGFESIKSYDFSSIRYVTNAGGALPVKHIHFLRELLPQAKIYNMYGQTECKRISYLPPEDIDRKPTSVGIAIPNMEMWLVDEENKRVGPGVIGQLVVRGATVMNGYWGKPEATAEKLKPGPLPGERVLYTGDFFQMDEEGYLYFVSRSDEIIKSRGEKVAPLEVENALMDIPGVKEAAVIGVPDEILGQAVKAFVVIEEGKTFSEKQLQKECRQRLENYMVPKFIVMVSSLPRTDTSKLNKRALLSGV